jgi:hypothetical protein
MLHHWVPSGHRRRGSWAQRNGSILLVLLLIVGSWAGVAGAVFEIDSHPAGPVAQTAPGGAAPGLPRGPSPGSAPPTPRSGPPAPSPPPPGPAPLDVKIDQTPGVATTRGISDEFVVNVSGGDGPVTVSYSGLPPGCPSSNVTVLLCTPTGGDGSSYSVRALATDSVGDTAVSSPVTFDVGSGAGPTGTLTLGGSMGDMPSDFWGINYDYTAPSGPDAGSFANSTVSRFYNETPFEWIRMPIVSEDPGGSYNSSTDWGSAFAFCSWTHCHSIVTVGGAGETAANGAWEVWYIQHHFHFDADLWVFGNEPDVFGWANATAYAATVHQWILDVRAFDSSAQFLGIEVTGDPSVDDAYLSDLVKEDGSLLSAFAIQTYPDNPPDSASVSNFMGALFGPHSVLDEAENARAVANAAGGGDLAMFDNEYNAGGTSDPAWASFRQGYPDVPFTVTSLIQALEAGVQQVSPWTLTSTSAVASTQLGTDGCDNGLIELSRHCDGITRTLNPMFYLYSQILDQIPHGSLRNVTIPGLPRVTAVQVTYDGYTYVLMANANAYTNATFDLGPGFPTEGNVRSTLFDPAAPIAPLISTFPLTSSSDGSTTSFTLPALGVLLLRFAPPAPSLDPD